MDVLVVDDDPVQRELVSLALQTAGATVDTAYDVASGLAKIAARAWDVVVVDFTLPDGSANDILAATDSRCVVLSGSEHARSEVPPGTPYFVKPDDLDDLDRLAEAIVAG